MYELSNFYEKYEGYTIVMKGFVYRAPDIQKKCDFALVRLSMWCCAADLSPIGFLVDSDNEVTFKDDDWVTVKYIWNQRGWSISDFKGPKYRSGRKTRRRIYLSIFLIKATMK